MKLQSWLALYGSVAVSATISLGTANARAQAEAPPPAAEPPPAAAAEPPPAAAAEPPPAAAFPLATEPPPVPPPQAVTAVPAPAATPSPPGNPKLKRLPKPGRAASDAPQGPVPAAGAPSAPLQPMSAGAGPRDQAPPALTPAPSGKKMREWGVMLDVGVPDGIMASAMYRPISWARVGAGLGFNGVSPGLRIGGTLVPFGSGPSFGVDLGHYFGGDANGLVRTIASGHEDSVLLEDVGYDYVNLRLGLEFGGDRFLFSMRGGLTYLSSTIHHVDDLINDSQSADSRTSVSVGEDPVLTAWAPSLDFGFGIFL